jgi:hypothetical protein
LIEYRMGLVSVWEKLRSVPLLRSRPVSSCRIQIPREEIAEWLTFPYLSGTTGLEQNQFAWRTWEDNFLSARGLHISAV